MQPPAERDRDRAYLIDVAKAMRYALVQRIEDSQSNGSHAPSPFSAPASMESPPALERLCGLFGLSAFERYVLVLCAAEAFWPDVGSLCGRIHQNQQLSYPTFSLALALHPEGNWSALLPESPLRHWQLIQVDDRTNNPLPLRRLSLEESVLHYLMGEGYGDSWLEKFAYRLTPIAQTLLPPSYEEIVERLADFLENGTGLIQLYGSDRLTQQEIASAACRRLNRQGKLISTAMLPQEPEAAPDWHRRWQREERFNRSLLLLDAHQNSYGGTTRFQNLDVFLSGVETPVLLLIDSPLTTSSLTPQNLEIHDPGVIERQQLWHAHLGDRLRGKLDFLAAQFYPSPSTIQDLCREALQFCTDDTELEEYLWEGCRKQGRAALDALAERVETRMGWDDLILPQAKLETLQSITTYVQQRLKVYHKWNFGKRANRGQGITALFSGDSGTGKTTAAEIIAKELRLDCYRIDLSRTVSKYIGETEKNLADIFAAAQGAGAVLLFDEADALFGKRGEVKEARDRYANQEVSYLLQRMETYPGLAILTSNIQNAIDQAFERRLKFIVKFPFPTAEQQQKIWERIFPPQAPTKNLDYKKLVKLSVTGGTIANLALDAAFRASREGGPIEMRHIKEAALAEKEKTGLRIPESVYLWE